MTDLFGEFVAGNRGENSARSRLSRASLAVLAAAMLLPLPCRAAGPTRAEAAQALRKAVQFFSTQVSTHGGYLWRYSGDLTLREAVQYALASVLNAQYPHGAWSHNYDRFPVSPPDAEHYPVRKASYPESWSRKWPKDFTGCYMINDGITPRMIATMLYAWEVYGDDRYLRAAERGGGFFLLAQLPEPQPAWAQQYDPNMQPAWDRAFEPPAVTGFESQMVLETLLLLSRKTGTQKYLEPIPRALDYLRRSRLPDGGLACFYELRTNRPIYFTRDRNGRHQFVYRQEQLVDHYAFLVPSRLDAIAAAYERRKQDAGTKMTARVPPLDLSETRVGEIIRGMDARGAWVELERLRHHNVAPPSGIIDSQTFLDNVAALCAFLRTNKSGTDEGSPGNPRYRKQ